MKRATSIILSLAFLALGILGITGVVPMFRSDLIYVNIAQIILGGIGFLAGVSESKKDIRDAKRAEKQRNKTDAMAEKQRNKTEANAAKLRDKTADNTARINDKAKENANKLQKQTDTKVERLENDVQKFKDKADQKSQELKDSRNENRGMRK